jgi:integrase
LDVAILHKVFEVALEEEMVSKNPVAFEGRPGDGPTRGAQPFSAQDVTRMQKHANQDLLSFILLRWTGLRGSDAVNLRWSEVHFDRCEIERVTLKRTKKVIVPIHSDLLAVLEMEFTRRKPKPEERVLRTASPAHTGTHDEKAALLPHGCSGKACRRTGCAPAQIQRHLRG